ncbi:hypothetical protein [Amycolatopsis echigonensis]|uniref:Dihydrofolate reductase n=1 Tax=Amycolatopsis echigonensis TaxID=2576905 RepID=A0A2N3WG78_9PSEU|nr:MULTISPECIES: hypothetical protein [Amycolatopsis]MBB2497949.1 hypothetical protein [Amycolatopsis echigonensis]PKV92867.1 hypothetical protein ATK30_3697 [Amycolatopsis niigatensis]
MGEVVAGASMSLVGFVAGPGESGFDLFFGWTGSGAEEVPTAQPGRSLRMSPASAKVVRAQLESTGALVVGRRLFDLTSGWGGTHPFGVPVLLGGGVSFFGEFGLGPVRLGPPDVTPGKGVTHLRYRVVGTNSRSFSRVSSFAGV